MRRIKQFRPSAGMVVAVIALFAALAGTATAARLITGKQIKNNSVTGRDVRNSSLTGGDVRDRSLGPNDFSGSVEGPRGPRGPEGLPGEPATRLFALVGDNGTLAASSGVVRSTNYAAGYYQLGFNRDVSGCAATTSTGAANGGFSGNRITSANRGGSIPATDLIVRAQRFNGANFVDENGGFSIALFC